MAWQARPGVSRGDAEAQGEDGHGIPELTGIKMSFPRPNSKTKNDP